MKKILNLILIVVTLGIILIPRFTELGTTPPGLHIDEVSFAADAKAIAETGRDTHNVIMPRVFQAFGEYKAPGLTYTMAFWSKLLGKMDNTVARLPSALAGVITIVMLVLTLRTIQPRIHPVVLGCIALILAYSPWHFDMSRIFYEAFSALAWFSISLYFATRQLINPKKTAKYEWYLLIITAAIAGYYYASIRYVVIIYLIIFSYLRSPNIKSSLVLSLKSIFILCLVGFLWIGDIFSNIGLNRLRYYQQKANIGSSLTIDEKRQFCYLAFNRNDQATKLCYVLWNKPVEKVTGALKVMGTYLGTDYLFIKGASEYGFDSEYGSFLLPSILLFVIGMIIDISRAFKQYRSVYTLYLSLIPLSLIPGALALNINMRMAMISLYIIAIVISIGLVEFINWANKSLRPIIRYILLLATVGVFGFYAFQSTVHYFFVFTKSNDLQWTSDSSKIFGYVKSVSANYDRIVDTELHGPLAPYFYGDITTTDVQNGIYNKPDDIGFFYLIKAGKYELRHINIFDLACETISQNDHRRTLVISNPYPELYSSRKFAAMSTNGALLLHEVYDLKDAIAYKERTEPNFISHCSPK